MVLGLGFWGGGGGGVWAGGGVGGGGGGGVMGLGVMVWYGV